MEGISIARIQHGRQLTRQYGARTALPAGKGWRSLSSWVNHSVNSTQSYMRKSLLEAYVARAEGGTEVPFIHRDVFDRGAAERHTQHPHPTPSNNHDTRASSELDSFPTSAKAKELAAQHRDHLLSLPSSLCSRLARLRPVYSLGHVPSAWEGHTNAAIQPSITLKSSTVHHGARRGTTSVATSP